MPGIVEENPLLEIPPVSPSTSGGKPQSYMRYAQVKPASAMRFTPCGVCASWCTAVSLYSVDGNIAPEFSPQRAQRPLRKTKKVLKLGVLGELSG
jgi:hypothetical protein